MFTPESPGRIANYPLRGFPNDEFSSSILLSLYRTMPERTLEQSVATTSESADGLEREMMNPNLRGRYNAS